MWKGRVAQRRRFSLLTSPSYAITRRCPHGRATQRFSTALLRSPAHPFILSPLRHLHAQPSSTEQVEDESSPPSPPPSLPLRSRRPSSPPTPSTSSSPLYSPVIGLEVHCQLIASTKLFSSSSTSFGSPPNSQTSFVDAALPGTLPSLNSHCVLQCIRTALALRTLPQPLSRFERKHYFYCDLPQGYQITQQRSPVIRGGEVGDVRIDRVQLEQDSGKSLHDLSPDFSYVDLNRAGMALIEVVTHPDLRGAEEAGAFIRKLSGLLRHIGVCRAQMEDGSMRVDVNVSVKRVGEAVGGERVEVKNVNSIRSVMRAIEYEVTRQSQQRERGEEVKRETRTFDARTGVTILLRSKENLLDYRFMPEPDLPPLYISEAEVERIRRDMGETPEELQHRLQDEYGLSEYDAQVLITEQGAVAFFERLVHGEEAGHVGTGEGERGAGVKRKQLRSPKSAVSWLTTDLFGRIRRQIEDSAKLHHIDSDEGVDDEEEGGDVNTPLRAGAAGRAGGSRVFLLAESPVSSAQLGSILDMIGAGGISGKVGKLVLEEMMDGRGELAPVIVQRKGWQQESDGERMEEWVRAVVEREQEGVSRYLKTGNHRFVGFLIGEVMKESQGKGNPKEAATRVRAALDQLRAQLASDQENR